MALPQIVAMMHLAVAGVLVKVVVPEVLEVMELKPNVTEAHMAVALVAQMHIAAVYLQDIAELDNPEQQKSLGVALQL